MLVRNYIHTFYRTIVSDFVMYIIYTVRAIWIFASPCTRARVYFLPLFAKRECTQAVYSIRVFSARAKGRPRDRGKYTTRKTHFYFSRFPSGGRAPTNARALIHMRA